MEICNEFLPLMYDCLPPFLADEGSAGGTREELPALVSNRGSKPYPQRHRDRLSHLHLYPAARRGRRAQRVSTHLLQVSHSK